MCTVKELLYMGSVVRDVAGLVLAIPIWVESHIQNALASSHPCVSSFYFRCK